MTRSSRDELVETLRVVNASRLRAGDADPGLFATEIDAAAYRLAVYGTLAPGQPNHGALAHLGGTWLRGTVRGRLHETGWGATMGYPGMTWDPHDDPFDADILESDALPGAWPELDRFEGEQYTRILVPVQTDRGVIVANIYSVRSSA